MCREATMVRKGRRASERASDGETKDEKRKRVKRFENKRKRKRKKKLRREQSMPIKCFVALQWKIFSFVLWKCCRRVETASFPHAFISTLDQCAYLAKHEKRWECKIVFSQSVGCFRQLHLQDLLHLDRWVFLKWLIKTVSLNTAYSMHSYCLY